MYFTRYFVLQLVQAFKIRQLNVWCVVCLIYCMVLFCFILFPCLFLIYLLFWFHLYNEKDKNVSGIKSLQTLIHKTSMIIFSNCMHTEFTHSFTVFSVGNEAKYWNQFFFPPLNCVDRFMSVAVCIFANLSLPLSAAGTISQNRKTNISHSDVSIVDGTSRLAL